MSISKKYRIIIVLLVSMGLASFLVLVRVARKSKQLNVILITIDALRADHLSCYGYKRDTSPNIDELAKKGVLFTQAIAQSSHTPPSMATISTSTYPHIHSLLTWGRKIKPGLFSIAQILKTKDYRTIFIGGNDSFSKALHGFNNGFDVFCTQCSDSEEITDKATKWLIEYANKPFFLWIHYMDVHPEYNSKPYDILYVDDEFYDKQRKLPIVETVKGAYGYKGIPKPLFSEKGNIDNPDYYIAQYDGAIRKVDENIGVLFNKLKELDLDKKTILMLTSDHGEMLGEHDYYFHHGWFLYEPLIRIPLIIKCAYVIPSNKVINGQISAHVDIAPTILDILKINKVKTMQGMSLLPVILNEDRYASMYVFSDEGFSLVCIRTQEWKLIYNLYNKEYELYNLKSDPQELNNLVFIEEEQFALLKNKLDDFINNISFSERMLKPILDSETKEKLKSLGYIQ
ncbi:MAG: sulfatase [Candidatus Omnitrophica bacterium]|nr:sulfatase [Candidatus Omnitrophota bacterium]